MRRPGAAFIAAPVFGAASVPVQLRLVIALAVGVPAAAASGMALPPEGIEPVPGFFFIIGEVVIGLAMGFSLKRGHAAPLLADEVIRQDIGRGLPSRREPFRGTWRSRIGPTM